MVKMVRKFKQGKMGWDLFLLKMPIFGQLVEKNILARTMRTLGTLVASGVPILEALNITRADSRQRDVRTNMYGKVTESIREGESIAKPMKRQLRLSPSFHPITAFFWFGEHASWADRSESCFTCLASTSGSSDEMVINMVDVGEETGELDTMLYKVADTYDEEVAVLTESLVSLMEPLMIILLGGMVGFIVIALFMPLVKLINSLTG